MNVMLVAGDADEGNLISETLRTCGHAVRVLPSAGKAVVAIVAERPDVIMVDLRLPDMNGLALVRLLRDYSGARGIPILAVAPLHEDFGPEQLQQAGCHGWITKPVNISEIVREVDRIGGLVITN
jgi:DNA-binding response OmpR family regulator